MTTTFATTTKLTTSFFPRDESVPLIEGTVGDAVLRAAEQFDSKIALIDGQPDPSARRQWTFNELAEDAKKVAYALLQHFEPGQRIAVWSANSPEWALIEFGAALAGLTLVTVNPAYLTHELVHVLGQSEAHGIILQDKYRGRNLITVLEEAKANLPNIKTVLPLSTWDAFIAAAKPCALPKVAPTDMAQIQYTSGTTGFPKGACLSHLGLSNNGRLFGQRIGGTDKDIWINVMPMFHTAGCGLATLGALQTGGTLVMAPDFEAGQMLDLFEQECGTIMLCVPTMLIRMLVEQEQNPRDLSSWRTVALGGAPVPADLARRAKELTGANVGIGFGQTEFSPYLTHTLINDPHPSWVETIGKPLPQTEVKIIDPSTGDTLPVGTSGEICGRGYGIMLGYYNAPEATAATIDKDGWLHTGDTGSMDEYGYCRIHGRLRDMIIRGGENIYPREIEDVLFTHPAIMNAAIIGLPDDDWGEIVAACIILREGRIVTPAELETFCRQHLASFKVPRNWHFMDSFPQTASGKIQKFALRDQLMKQSA
ncbi:AMP-binding protein [Kordiimonas pumila]|uniref:AMP-binding protein n=1 Tax=Kordiimonas pumila TaxID=2161677 RepID=A0ABV7DA36_9PROT|nr:AMP-binding protein [Kordiimonas pumila]